MIMVIMVKNVMSTVQNIALKTPASKQMGSVSLAARKITMDHTVTSLVIAPA